MTVTGQGHDPQHIWDPLSRQRLEIHTDLVAMEHLQEMTSWESNGHVTPWLMTSRDQDRSTS